LKEKLFQKVDKGGKVTNNLGLIDGDKHFLFCHFLWLYVVKAVWKIKQVKAVLELCRCRFQICSLSSLAVFKVDLEDLMY
jgi:hypothetical protein